MGCFVSQRLPFSREQQAVRPCYYPFSWKPFPFIFFFPFSSAFFASSLVPSPPTPFSVLDLGEALRWVVVMSLGPAQQRKTFCLWIFSSLEGNCFSSPLVALGKKGVGGVDVLFSCCCFIKTSTAHGTHPRRNHCMLYLLDPGRLIDVFGLKVDENDIAKSAPMRA